MSWLSGGSERKSSSELASVRYRAPVASSSSCCSVAAGGGATDWLLPAGLLGKATGVRDRRGLRDLARSEETDWRRRGGGDGDARAGRRGLWPGAASLLVPGCGESWLTRKSSLSEGPLRKGASPGSLWVSTWSADSRELRPGRPEPGCSLSEVSEAVDSSLGLPPHCSQVSRSSGSRLGSGLMYLEVQTLVLFFYLRRSQQVNRSSISLLFFSSSLEKFQIGGHRARITGQFNVIDHSELKYEVSSPPGGATLEIGE